MRRIRPRIFKEEEPIEKPCEREKTTQLFTVQILSVSEAAGGFKWKGSREIPKAVLQTCTVLPSRWPTSRNEGRGGARVPACSPAPRETNSNLTFSKTPEAGRWGCSVPKWRWTGILSLHLPWPEADKQRLTNCVTGLPSYGLGLGFRGGKKVRWAPAKCWRGSAWSR